jgi:hypothetical protein
LHQAALATTAQAAQRPQRLVRDRQLASLCHRRNGCVWPAASEDRGANVARRAVDASVEPVGFRLLSVVESPLYLYATLFEAHAIRAGRSLTGRPGITKWNWQVFNRRLT